MASYQSLVVAASGFDLVTFTEGANVTFTRVGNVLTVDASDSGGGGDTVADGDYGDITVSSTGVVWTIDNTVISTYGRTLTVAVDAPAARTVLGLGSAALNNTGDFDAAGAAAAAQAASQPLDGDLSALAVLSGTNTIYYRSGANTWTAVTISTGLDFTGGTLSATGGSVPTTITVADTTDSTCFVALFESATGDLAPKTDGGLLYDASTAVLSIGSGSNFGTLKLYDVDDTTYLTITAASFRFDFDAAIRVAYPDTNVSAAIGLLDIYHHATSGTPTTGMGDQINLKCDSTTQERSQARIQSEWVTATDASRKARLTLSVFDTAIREGLRIGASGSAPQIGFLGASESARLSSPDLGTLVITFGLASGTPTFAIANVSGLGTGVGTFLATPSSANLATAVTDETGSGALVFATSPTLVTPILGVAAATSINKVAITAPATSATLTVADGKTLTASNTITFTATDGSTLAIGTGGTLGTAAYTASSAYQASDAELSAIAGLTSAADRLPYFTGSGTAALATFVAEARTLVALTDPGADRILFWDDSASSYAYLTAGTGLSISGTTITATGGGGTGDFVGPSSSTNTAIVKFDGTTGKLGQNSGVLIDSSNNVSGITGITAQSVLLSASGNTQTLNPTTTGTLNLNISGTKVLQGDNTGDQPIATQTQQETATDSTALVTSGRQHYHPSAAKAWVVFNTVTTTSISASYNVASLTDNGTGDTTITFTTAFSSVNYCGVGLCGTGGGLAYGIFGPFNATPTTTAFRVVTGIANVSANDVAYASVSFFGDQ